jgi:hypothetical protein
MVYDGGLVPNPDFNSPEIRRPFSLNSTHPNRSSPGKPLPSPCHPDPDFLLRAASDDHVCGSPQREPQADQQDHGS